MPTRAEYTECMRSFITGTGKTKEERQVGFCTGAKICSQKATSVEEAEKICREQPPKEPKPRKTRSGKCNTDLAKLASCVSTRIDLESLTAENLAAQLESAMQKCGSSKPTSKTTYRRFMNSCLKETGGGGDFLTSQRDIKTCQIKWNETRGA